MASKKHTKDDPRDETLAVKFHVPKYWTQQADSMSSLAMLLAGGTMLTRNAALAWPALFVGMNSYINQHPLRLKEGGQSLVSLLAAIGCVLTANLPRVLLQTKPVQTPTI